jgi:IS5 family transposase
MYGPVLRKAAGRIGNDDVLYEGGALPDRRAFRAILKRGLKRSGAGPQGYDLLLLFKCPLNGQ